MKPLTLHKKNFALWLLIVLIGGLTLFNAAATQPAAELDGQALVAALREGGFNIYFRHAATDWSQNASIYLKLSK